MIEAAAVDDTALEKIVDAKVLLALQKRESSLGLRGGESLSSADAGDGKEKLKDKETPKTYLEAVADKVAKLKVKKSEAHVLVQKENPELYRAHNAGRFHT